MRVLANEVLLYTLNVQQIFLLSDVLHCTNMNTDFIDFRN